MGGIDDRRERDKIRKANARAAAKGEAPKKQPPEPPGANTPPQNYPFKPACGKPTEECRSVLAYLNQRTGKTFSLVPVCTWPIDFRLEEGATVQDCQSVIDTQWKAWGSDHRMKKFLNPQTLFGEKFPIYLGQRRDLNGSGGLDDWSTPNNTTNDGQNQGT